MMFLVIDLAQKWSRWVVNHIYNVHPDGLPGNDDYGTMSSWLAFASLGFYPRAGCPEYVLSSPIFDQISVIKKFFYKNINFF
jgi:putative alpha-1,2-mannosidase